MLTRVFYCTNPIEMRHTFIVPVGMVYEVVRWCEVNFGERCWANWRAMLASPSTDGVVIIPDDDKAMQFRLRWC